MSKLRSHWSSERSLGERLVKAQYKSFGMNSYKEQIASLLANKEFFIPDFGNSIFSFHFINLTKIDKKLNSVANYMDNTLEYLDEDDTDGMVTEDLVNLRRIRALDQLFHVVRASQKFPDLASEDPDCFKFFKLLTAYKTDPLGVENVYYDRVRELEMTKTTSKRRSGILKTSSSGSGALSPSAERKTSMKKFSSKSSNKL